MNGIEYDGWVLSHVREYLKELEYRLPLEDMITLNWQFYANEAESVVRPQSSGLLDKQLNFVATKWGKKVDDFILLCGKVVSS